MGNSSSSDRKEKEYVSNKGNQYILSEFELIEHKNHQEPIDLLILITNTMSSVKVDDRYNVINTNKNCTVLAKSNYNTHSLEFNIEEQNYRVKFGMLITNKNEYTKFKEGCLNENSKGNEPQVISTTDIEEPTEGLTNEHDDPSAKDNDITIFKDYNDDIYNLSCAKENNNTLSILTNEKYNLVSSNDDGISCYTKFNYNEHDYYWIGKANNTVIWDKENSLGEYEHGEMNAELAYNTIKFIKNNLELRENSRQLNGVNSVTIDLMNLIFCIFILVFFINQ